MKPRAARLRMLGWVLSALALAVFDAALARQAGQWSPDVGACATQGQASCSLTPFPSDGAGAPFNPDLMRASVLLFTSEACPACRRMEPVIERAREECDSLGTGFISVDVETTEGGALAAQWGVTQTPTLLMLDSGKRERRRLIGVQPLTEVREAVERAYGTLCVAHKSPGVSHG